MKRLKTRTLRKIQTHTLMNLFTRLYNWLIKGPPPFDQREMDKYADECDVSAAAWEQKANEVEQLEQQCLIRSPQAARLIKFMHQRRDHCAARAKWFRTGCRTIEPADPNTLS